MFQSRQIHFALTVRQRSGQQLMLRHDRPALKDMSDRVSQRLWLARDGGGGLTRLR